MSNISVTDQKVSLVSGDPVFQQESTGDHLVVINAENYYELVDGLGDPTSAHQWEVGALTGSEGRYLIQLLPNDGTSVGSPNAEPEGAPKANYLVNFTQTGTHYIWVRFNTPSGTDDSFFIGIDDAGYTSAMWGVGTNHGSWKWDNELQFSPTKASIEVSSTGLHEINLAGREDGMRIDRILLTTNASYTPTGNGPAESSREDAPTLTKVSGTLTATAPETQTSDSTSLSITMPPANSGDKVILVLGYDGTSSTISFSSDLKIISHEDADAGALTAVVAETVVTGAESWAASGGTITATLSAAQEAAWRVFKIEEWGGETEVRVSSSTGTATSLDTPLVSYPSDKANIITACFGDGGDLVLTNPPKYENFDWENTTGAGGVSFASSTRYINDNLLEDPGSYSHGDTAQELLTLSIAVPQMPKGVSPILVDYHPDTERNGSNSNITTDLTRQGTLDWYSWGDSVVSDVSNKNNGSLLNTYTKIGTFTELRTTGSTNASWLDNEGDGTTETTSSNTYVYQTVQDAGFRLTTNALGSGRKIVVVSWNAFDTDAEITASISDASSSDVTFQPARTVSGSNRYLSRFVVEPSSTSATLQIDIIMRGSTGNVALSWAYVAEWPYDTHIQDSFTNTNGTGIEDHTPNKDIIASGYSAEASTFSGSTPSGSGGISIESNQIEFSVSSEAAIAETQSLHNIIWFDWVVSSTSGHRLAIPIRRVDKDNEYWFNIREVNNDASLYEIDGGSQSLIATVGDTTATNSTYNIEIYMKGTEVEYIKDAESVLISEQTSNIVPTATYAGLGVATITTNNNLDNVIIWAPIQYSPASASGSITFTDAASLTSYHAVENDSGGSVRYGQIATTSNGSSGVSVSPPAGVQEGDKMKLIATRRNPAQTVNTPTGWTADTEVNNFHVFYKTAGASESNVTVDGGGASSLHAVIISGPTSMSDAFGSSDFDSRGSGNSDGTAPIDYATLTAGSKDNRLIFVFNTMKHGDITLDNPNTAAGSDFDLRDGPENDGSGEFNMVSYYYSFSDSLNTSLADEDPTYSGTQAERQSVSLSWDYNSPALVTFTDSATGEQVAPGAATGTVTFTDSATGEVTSGDVIATGSVVFTDADSLTSYHAVDATDTVLFTDTDSLTSYNAVAASDTAFAISSAALLGDGFPQAFDSVTFTDTASISSLQVVAATDGVVFTDTENLTSYNAIDATGSAVFTDTDSLTSYNAVDATDTTVFTDTNSLTSYNAVDATDTTVFTDTNSLTSYNAVDATGSTVFTDTDSLTSYNALQVSDTAFAISSAAILGTGSLVASAEAVFTVAANLGFDGVVDIDATGSAVFSETASLVGVIDAVATDDVLFTDVANGAITIFADASDSVVFSDSVTLTAKGFTSATDDAVFTDSVTAVGEASIEATDSTVFTDNVVILGVGSASKSDSVVFTETGSLVGVSLTSATGQIVFLDSAEVESVAVAIASDTVVFTTVKSLAVSTKTPTPFERRSLNLLFRDGTRQTVERNVIEQIPISRKRRT